ncbi:MAG: hypothetical protein AB9834_15670 [Lentimicrobium sp.]
MSYRYMDIIAKRSCLLLMFIAIHCLVMGQVSETAVSKSDSLNESQKERKHRKDREKEPLPPVDLSEPAFIDYTEATIFMSPGDSLIEHAYLRRNFTDQFVSVWQNPGRIYPASMIYGISQDGKYYRTCKFDSRNAVFGEQIVKGKMSLYYCRKLPQEAGLVEFISVDPGNPGYRNFMIMEYRDKARYMNDYYYFVTLEGDSLHPVLVVDFAQFANDYLRNSPEACNLLMAYGKKKSKLQRVIAPVIVGLVCVAVVSAGSIEKGILISSVLIAGGGIYYLVKLRKKPSRPQPADMAKIIEVYNNAQP